MFPYVQDLILGKLITSEGIRYSELRPEEIDDDLYNYHLQELVKKGYVEKGDKLYVLSEKGKKYVQRYDVHGKQKDYFKVSVIAHTLNAEGNILMQERTRQPYFGDIYGGVSGKVLLGEKIEDTARRKMKEETGLDCVFKFLGVLRKTRRTKNGKVFEDTLYHICFGENSSGDLIEENEFGKHFWGKIGDAIKFQRLNVTAGPKSEEVLKRIEDKNFDLFYFHEEVVLETV